MPLPLPLLLASKELAAHKLRTAFSVISVALGTAVILAADYTSQAIRNAGSELGQASGTLPFASEFLGLALTGMGFLILLVAGFLIYNAFAMSITQRQQLVGALRALGTTRPQIMRIVLAEALLTGALGVSLGVALGWLMGQGLAELLDQWLNIATGQGNLRPTALALALGAGLGITLAASLWPAWRASWVSPLAALRPHTAEPPPPTLRQTTSRLLVALLLLVGIPFFLLIAPPARGNPTPAVANGLTAGLSLGWLLGWVLLLPLLVLVTRTAITRATARPLLRLMADNLGRSQGRVRLTILNLALALLAIVSVTGMVNFSFGTLVSQSLGKHREVWLVGAIPPSTTEAVVDWEMVSEWDINMRLSADFMAELTAVTDGRTQLLPVFHAFIPELAVMPGMPVYFVDPPVLRQTNLFIFQEGDWATAERIMAEGCGALLIPRVAAQMGAGLHEAFAVQGADGVVSCTVAGIGRSDLFVGTPLLSLSAAEQFAADPTEAFVVMNIPTATADPNAIKADQLALLEGYPSYSLMEAGKFMEGTAGMVDDLQTLLNSMLVLAILAAALGVVNSTLLAILERRQEFGLLRAVGCTRPQIIALVVGEAGLLGLAGGVMGLGAGLGLVAIFIGVNGGSMWGLNDINLGAAVGESLTKALGTGGVGLLAAPLLTAVAAYFPARHLVRGSAISTLNPAYEETSGYRPQASGA